MRRSSLLLLPSLTSYHSNSGILLFQRSHQKRMLRSTRRGLTNTYGTYPTNLTGVYRTGEQRRAIPWYIKSGTTHHHLIDQHQLTKHIKHSAPSKQTRRHPLGMDATQDIDLVWRPVLERTFILDGIRETWNRHKLIDVKRIFLSFLYV